MEKWGGKLSLRVVERMVKKGGVCSGEEVETIDNFTLE